MRRVRQSPDYPMQFMLGVYEFDGDHEESASGGPATAYPKEFVIDYVRGYRRSAT